MPIISGGTGGGGTLSGVTVTGTAASGQVPVASSSSAGAWKYPPGFEIGYDQITTAVNIASTTEATPTALISCAAHTFDGGPVLLTVFGWLQTSTLATIHQITLMESTTEISRIGQLVLASAAVNDYAVTYCYRFTPSAGSHTYTVSGYTNNSGGTQAIFQGGASGTSAISPAFARFAKV